MRGDSVINGHSAVNMVKSTYDLYVCSDNADYTYSNRKPLTSLGVSTAMGLTLLVTPLAFSRATVTVTLQHHSHTTLTLSPRAEVVVHMSNTDASVEVYPPEVHRLRGILASDPEGGWDKAWRDSVTPWDRGALQAPLQKLVESGRVSLPTSGRAIVPGCGRGYEVVYIANTLHLDTLGLDLSSAAIHAAQQNAAKAVTSPKTKLQFIEGDFFKYEVPESDRFDFGFDYTFFCAIPPSHRADWGSQMRALIKQGGLLVTLMWPIDGERDDGPPFSVSEAAYTDALKVKEGMWSEVLNEKTEGREGKERIAVWRRN